MSAMPVEPRLILQVPSSSPVSRQLSADPPPSVASGEIVVEHGTADAQGNLEAPDSGQVVLSVPSPEALPREPEEIRHVIAQAGTGTEPLVLVIEAAEELRETELGTVLAGARHARRPVILRVIRDA
jgi:hypothetical protein